MDINPKKQGPGDPGPEVREKIVKDIMKTVEAKTTKPSNDQDELAQIARICEDIRHRVLLRYGPILEQSKLLPANHPQYIHNHLGRAHAMMTLTKMFVEELRVLGKDELIFMLGVAYAELGLITLV
jgi:hypothetical protein